MSTGVPETNERNYHHGNLRQVLLRAAEQELALQGSDKLSLRALARQIGVSQTAPYRHFVDKNALLAALATRGYINLTTSMIRAEKAAPESPADKLRATSHAYVEFALAHKALFKLMFGPALDPHEKYPELFEASRQTFILVHAIVKKGVEDGVFRQDDVEYLTNTAWAGVHGIVTLKLDRSELFDRHIIDLDRQIDTSLGIFIAGIKI
ncbi:MAG: AcrR family transcriptional regulator [Halieaceae bacterium]|jgi:AcrR family transcriptional regulator